MQYAELHCHSFYSLLDRASSPEALLDRAAELGIKHLALTDRAGLCRSSCPNPGHPQP
ncbi:MAG: PHP domain-containing protein [Chloroflexi bacterium]|nr:PHP domain-containing protein [Chloroflexota bacterium]